jgi:lipid II:glycine glycyltransferase (peptidoglycan interpeptide bridge formation enzyme)
LALEEDGQWSGAAEVLLWPIPKLGRFIAYVPRGPVVDPAKSAKLLEALAQWAKAHQVLYLRVEPAWIKARFGKGWRRARHHLQLAETYTLDLNKSAEELQEPMSRKHRQYIRKAERDGVVVERGSDLDAMYDLYALTAQRAGFGIHEQEYYTELHQELGEWSYLYVARHQGRPVAFLWLAAAARTAYELYGGVSDTGQDLKANYYLKWRAIEEMQAAGYQVYDFNGRLNDGVSRFKEGFGPDETDYVGAYDYPVNAIGYHVWEHLWPVAKPIGRRLMKAIRGQS